jgi:hypothetical protein
MLVKVKNKATGNEQVITQKAYNLAKKRYQFIGNAPQGSDLDGQIEEETPTPQIQESPNLKTAAQEEEKGAEAVVVNEAPKVPAKRGPKPKNQISSPATAVES